MNIVLYRDDFLQKKKAPTKSFSSFLKYVLICPIETCLLELMFVIHRSKFNRLDITFVVFNILFGQGSFSLLGAVRIKLDYGLGSVTSA